MYYLIKKSKNTMIFHSKHQKNISKIYIYKYTDKLSIKLKIFLCKYILENGEHSTLKK